MSARRILVSLVLAVAFGGALAAPALAAKEPPAPPQITSALAVNSRTVGPDVDLGQGGPPLRRSHLGRLADLHDGDDRRA